MPAVFGAKAGNALYELGIAAREPFSVITDIIFKSGTAMPAHLQAPVIDFQLITPQTGCNQPLVCRATLPQSAQRIRHSASVPLRFCLK